MQLRPIVFSLLLAGCAVQNQPQGGPKDEQAPVIKSMEPKVGELNFTANKAVIVFDEYIQAPKLRGVLSSSPEIEGLRFEVTGKRLELTWEDGRLAPETTYRINLGDEIQDLNERNPVKNLQLVWSTGGRIDSMQVSGEVVSDFSKLTDLKVQLIQENGDSSFVTRFSTSPTKEGKFSFSYLPLDTFDLVVFEDINFNGQWDAKETPGFMRSVISSLDSQLLRIPFVGTPFEPTSFDTASVDSLGAILDTLSSNTGSLVQFEIPPHEHSFALWLAHSNGWTVKLNWPATTDTVLTEARLLFPGKYTLQGFEDKNGNQQWDGANLLLDQQPERVLAPQKFDFKENWEITQPVNFE